MKPVLLLIAGMFIHWPPFAFPPKTMDRTLQFKAVHFENRVGGEPVRLARPTITTRGYKAYFNAGGIVEIPGTPDSAEFGTKLYIKILSVSQDAVKADLLFESSVVVEETAESLVIDARSFRVVKTFRYGKTVRIFSANRNRWTELTVTDVTDQEQ